MKEDVGTTWPQGPSRLRTVKAPQPLVLSSGTSLEQGTHIHPLAHRVLAERCEGSLPSSPGCVGKSWHPWEVRRSPCKHRGRKQRLQGSLTESSLEGKWQQGVPMAGGCLAYLSGYDPGVPGVSTLPSPLSFSPFIQQILAECLLCARPYVRHRE